jgi:hypothetical protein
MSIRKRKNHNGKVHLTEVIQCQNGSILDEGGEVDEGGQNRIAKIEIIKERTKVA